LPGDNHSATQLARAKITDEISHLRRPLGLPRSLPNSTTLVLETAELGNAAGNIRVLPLLPVSQQLLPALPAARAAKQVA